MSHRGRQVSEVELDQSGKIEDTGVNTVLALSNGIRRTVRVPASVKCVCLNVLRQKGKTSRAIYMPLFVAALFLLIAPVSSQAQVFTMDIEYEGHEAEIKARLLRLALEHGVKLNANQLTFRLVGKHSPAHHLALAVFRGERTSDVNLKPKDLLRLLK